MTTCPSSSRKSPPSCSEDPYKSWPASRLKLGQRVETSSSSSSERGSRTSTSERSFTSSSSDIVILCAKQKPTILFYEVAGCATGSARLLSAHNWGGLQSLYRGNVCVLTRLYFNRSYRRARTPGGIHLRLRGYLDVTSKLLCGQLCRTPCMRTSENAQNANFREFLFHALR